MKSHRLLLPLFATLVASAPEPILEAHSNLPDLFAIASGLGVGNFADALKRAGLQDEVAALRKVTVLAPIDAAVSGEEAAGTARLDAANLRYHVVKGVFASRDLADQQLLETLGGKHIRVHVTLSRGADGVRDIALNNLVGYVGLEMAVVQGRVLAINATLLAPARDWTLRPDHHLPAPAPDRQPRR